MSRPPLLEGIRVVELTDGLAGAFAGRLFARLGAEVVLVERPGTGSEVRWKPPFLADEPGVERSGLFHFVAAGKKSVSLAPETPEGGTVLEALVARADLLIEDRSRDLPLLRDERALRAWNPKATILSLLPFAADGPYRDWRVTELQLAAMAGWMVQVGEPKRTPLATSSDTTSAFVPGIFGAVAAMASILGGGGRRIDLASNDALLAATRVNETYFHATGIEIRRFGRAFVGWAPTYRVFEASDGWVTCAASTDQQVEALMTLAGVSDARFATREQRYADSEAFVAALQRWFSARTREQIFHEAQRWRVPMGSVAAIDEVFELDQLAARKFFEDVEHPVLGRVRLAGGPASFPEGPAFQPKRAPLLGEHTAEILRAHGVDGGRLAALRAQGVA